MELPLFPLIKSKNATKSDKYDVKIKLFRYPTSEKSDLYKFKMALFDNGNTEEFLFFKRNFQMTFGASGMLTDRAKIQYLCMLLHCEA